MYANLNNDGEEIITGNDSIVIVDNLQSIRGGRTLDVTGFTPAVIKAGHVIIQKTADKSYKPMPVVGTGGIETLGAIVGGSSYTNNGTYTDVALTGGSGSGAEATIVVAGNTVTSVTITEPGTGYKAGDTLSAAAADIGTTGTGFSVGVATASTEASAYGSLPSGHTYAGILVASIMTETPFAGIMVRGTVNPAAAPFSMTSILSAVKTALPLIDFRED
jgi:hypothetical protein